MGQTFILIKFKVLLAKKRRDRYCLGNCIPPSHFCYWIPHGIGCSRKALNRVTVFHLYFHWDWELRGSHKHLHCGGGNVLILWCVLSKALPPPPIYSYMKTKKLTSFPSPHLSSVLKLFDKKPERTAELFGLSLSQTHTQTHTHRYTHIHFWTDNSQVSSMTSNRWLV
jgi:hypothetical protein